MVNTEWLTIWSEPARPKAIAHVTDKKSWYVLGNAHLAQFFQLKHDPADLSKALKAYRRAMPVEAKKVGGANGNGDANMDTNPDLFFNRATVHKYLENYDEAIADFRAAAALDPELPVANMILTLNAHEKYRNTSSPGCRLKAKRLALFLPFSIPATQIVLGSMEAKTQKEALKRRTQKENSLVQRLKRPCLP